MNYGSHYITKRTELVQLRRKVSAEYDSSLGHIWEELVEWDYLQYTVQTQETVMG